jgi:acyl carrier protein
MGLDGVELIMAIEEGFGITITDAEAEACACPAAVIDLVFGKLRTSDERVCVSQRGFYLLRKALAQTLGVPRQEVELDLDIRSFTAGRSEREVWNNLKATVGARSWPDLARPRWLTAGLWCLALVTFGAVIAVSQWILAAIITGLVASFAARLTHRFRSCIPARYSRLQALVPFAVTSDAIAWTRDQVAALVRELVIDQLMLREGQYREDAHFVNDLGLDR